MEVSIIIPCTRGERVLCTIESIVEQKTKYSYEILVVGKKSDLPKFLLGVKRVISNNKLKPGQARNLGAKKASGKYFLFIDDDCIASKDWIEKNIEFLKSRKNVGAVGGKISGHSKKFFGLCTDYTNFWRQQGNSLRRVDQLYTASLGVKKEAFLKVDGFNEKLMIGEDVDFVNKLTKKGYFCYYNPEIVVFHDHKRDSLRKFLQYMYRNGLLTGLDILKTYQGNIMVKFLWPVFKKAYFLFIILMAILYTGACFCLNVSSNWKIVFLTPFIFLGYLVYHCGIAVRLLKEMIR